MAKSTRCERLVDERFLAFKSLGRRTAWQWIFSVAGVHDLRIELGHGSQSVGPSAVESIERLPKYVLATRGIVSQIKPIADR